MGIDQAMVATGNAFDVALERLRDDVAAARGGRGRRRSSARALRGAPGARAPHGRSSSARSSRRPARSWTSRAARGAGAAASSGRTCSARATRRLLGGLRPRPLRRASSSSRTGSRRSRWTARFTFLRYVGTDLEAFFRGVPARRGRRRASVIPRGPARHPRREAVRGGVAEAQERAPARPDQGRARPAREADRRGRGAAALGAREPRRHPRDPPAARPGRAPTRSRRLRAPALGAPAGEALEPLLARLFATTDETFDRALRALLRRRRAAPAPLPDRRRRHHHHQGAVEERLLQLGQREGLRVPAVQGHRAVRHRRDDERHGPRDASATSTATSPPRRRQEIRRHAGVDAARASSTATTPRRSCSAAAAERSSGEARAADDRRGARSCAAARRTGASAADLAARVYTQEEIERGVALNAALILEDPRQLRPHRSATCRRGDPGRRRARR